MAPTPLTDTPQWTSGRAVEAFLDAYYRQLGFVVTRTTPHEERRLHLGDRRFTKDGQTYLVEYKSGIQTHYTGNLFLETISVDTTGTPGWVLTCRADFILYAALLDHLILVFRPARLRRSLADLQQRFPVTKTGRGQNKGYDTHGVLVPLHYAVTDLADKVIELSSRPCSPKVKTFP